MTPADDKIIKFLLRKKDGGEVDPRLDNFLDRLLLRIYSSTSLIVSLLDAAANEDGEIELVFNELPQEIVPKVVSIIGIPGINVYTFRDDETDHVYHGFKMTPDEEFLDEL